MVNQIKNIKGQRFGMLEVLEIAELGKAGKSVVWKCKCDCGAIIERSSGVLVGKGSFGRVQSCGCVQEYDLTNKKFGSLTAIRKVRKEKGLGVVWEFQCDCDNLIEKIGSHVKRGAAAQHCGCTENRGGNKKNDLRGQKYGQATVLEFSHTSGRKKSNWKCRCDCGIVFVMSGYNLRRLKNPNCGCTKVLRPSVWRGKGTIPGSYYTKTKRGADMRNLSFHITLDNMWDKLEEQQHKCALTGVKIEFRRWDNKVPTTASIDRIDSNLGYTVDNIQWVHKVINAMKMNLREDEFVNWCTRVVNKMTKKLDA